MLSLKNITKVYGTADGVRALRGVSFDFRRSEFVSILGPSGCGKTTLLNIIGGLDRYTEGDLVIRGVSTREYTDRDWDTYRNHSVGFVFQNYQLIPHQTVLANVELALTLSGVDKAERRRRATEALERVGLADQLHKKPNQMSGGQMQRVAIARALVNDPDILLADEPTGALDTQTSVQIMEILREISRDRLIIMVTHNPDLAQEYSTRIIKLLDGEVVSDSNPYIPTPEERAADAAVISEQTVEAAQPPKVKGQRKKRTQMSFWTALTLSFNNLLTKKARTALTSFAGSIGIIGIALILALSNGIQIYIDGVEADALSSYPIALESYTMDMQTILTEIAGAAEGVEGRDPNKIYSSDTTLKMFQALVSGIKKNDLKAFKEFIESGETDIADPTVSTIEYVYGVTPYIWHKYVNSETSQTTIYQSNPPKLLEQMIQSFGMAGMGFELFDQLIDNPELLRRQYELLDGKWPTAKDELVLIVDKNNQINDLYLYALGMKDQAELNDIVQGILSGNPSTTTSIDEYTYAELMSTEFILTVPGLLYEDPDGDGVYSDILADQEKIGALLDTADTEGSGVMKLKVVGIIRPGKDATATSISGIFGYSSQLTDYLIEEGKKTDVVRAQLATPGIDVLTGLPFPKQDSLGQLTDAQMAATMLEVLRSAELTPAAKQQWYTTIMSYITMAQQNAAAEAYVSVDPTAPDALAQLIVDNYDTLAPLMGAEPGAEAPPVGMLGMMLGQMEAEEYTKLNISIIAYIGNGTDIQPFATLMTGHMMTYSADPDTVYAATVDAIDENTPMLVTLYKEKFAKESDSSFEQNADLLGYADPSSPKGINIYPISFDQKDHISEIIAEYNRTHGEEYTITYTDMIGVLFSSISLILNIITYVLVAFVAISLVVSSIMIGIITYISVLERTREIGILRAVGASKKDISRVFNAETLVIGFGAGLMGIVASLILIIPINAIIRALSGINDIGAALPFAGAVILVLISMVLTLVAGLIPSHKAAKKDPVEALRSE